MKLLKMDKLFVLLIIVSALIITAIYKYSQLRLSYSFLFKQLVNSQVTESRSESTNNSAADVALQYKTLSNAVNDLMAFIVENFKKGQDSSTIIRRTFSNVEPNHKSVTKQVEERKVDSSLALQHHPNSKVSKTGVQQGPQPGKHQPGSHTAIPPGKKPNSQQNTKANAARKNKNFKQMTTLPPKDVIPDPCFPAPENLTVHPISQQECGAPYVIMNSGGRLGNKLCQYVSLFLLRHLFGVRVSMQKQMNATLSRILRTMMLPVQDPSCFPKGPKWIHFRNLYKMLYKAANDARARAPQSVVTEPLLKRSYFVYNNPCPRDLFMAHRGLIRRLLTFKEELLQRARDNINQALRRLNKKYKREQVTLITVHVRRGDYTNYIHVKFNLTQLDEVYFNRAFDFYRKKVANPVFVVVSNDHAWCRKFLHGRDVIVAGSLRDPAMDMAILSLGDHTVSTYGTFSFMGSVLEPGNFTHPLSDNKKYNLYECVDSPAFHYILRDPN
ncbi:galactoside alpha-(1,2)-fucosyltransferase 1-like [Panulirus ornatus]|uniref:galactoside alpha-(1,2)-fucosyltransferase 1-like n=1 Tax=Panulirus ornatus TaxID=150431 RepID=UPI003A8B673D